MEGAQDDTAHSRIRAATKNDADAWLHAFPMSAVGLRMDDEEIRVATASHRLLSCCTSLQSSPVYSVWSSDGATGKKSKGRHS